MLFRSKQWGLLIAEGIGVKVVDCVSCDEGDDKSDGPDNQNRHIAEAMVPIWGPVVAWKHSGSQSEWFPH